MNKIIETVIQVAEWLIERFLTGPKSATKKIKNKIIKKKEILVQVESKNPLTGAPARALQVLDADLLYDWSRDATKKEALKIGDPGFFCIEGMPFIRGIRDDARPNYFDDYFVVSWRQSFDPAGRKQALIIPGSTRPGITGGKAGILAPTLQPRIWTFGKTARFKHTKGKKISILMQRGPNPIYYYRDENKNLSIDSEDTKGKGWRGCQFHPGGFSNRRGRTVGGWSTMCQVVEDIDEYWCVMSIFERYYKYSKKQAKQQGVKWAQPYFSYAISKVGDTPKKVKKQLIQHLAKSLK